MTWGGLSPGFDPAGSSGAEDPARSETIELVGPHLRVRGTISLLRFNRLSDLVNHNSGYMKLVDARLMRRNGDPTNLVVPELMVNPDLITFISQREGEITRRPTTTLGAMDRPSMERAPREFVVFTAGHTLTGSIFVFANTDATAFVDSPDPRFIPMVNVTARSLADRRVISHFALVLMNRTQMTAAALLEKAGGAGETGVVVD